MTLNRNTRSDASLNISNGKHLYHGSNSMQTPLYDFVSPNANSGTANTTNTLIFVCRNHTKRQILRNQLIDLHATLKHDSISPCYNKQIKITKTVITTTNKIDHSNNNATFRTTNETSKQPTINHHGNLATNNLVQTINGYHKQPHNPIILLLIIILTVRHINHLIKHSNDDHHISNNHNNLPTDRFHLVTIIQDHHQITDDSKTLLFVPII